MYKITSSTFFFISLYYKHIFSFFFEFKSLFIFLLLFMKQQVLMSIIFYVLSIYYLFKMTDKLIDDDNWLGGYWNWLLLNDLTNSFDFQTLFCFSLQLLNFYMNILVNILCMYILSTHFFFHWKNCLSWLLKWWIIINVRKTKQR